MRNLLCLFVATFLLIGCATSPPAAPELTQARAELEAQKAALRRCQARIDAAEASNAALAESLQAAADTQAALEAEIAGLKARLNALDEAAPDPTTGGGELAALRRELRGAQAGRLAAERRSDQLAAENEAARQSLSLLRNEMSALQDAFSAQASSLSRPDAYIPDLRSSTDSSLAIDTSQDGFDSPNSWATYADSERGAASVEARRDDAAFITKKVYYASTRARLVRDWTDYLYPFLTPLVLVVLYLLLRFASRRYIKEQYQSRAGLIVAVTLLLPAAIFMFLAINKTLGMRDNDQRLMVQYGNKLREADGAPYERGFVEVSIPKARKVGEVNLRELTRLEVVVDRTKHFQLVSIRPAGDAAGFYEDLRATVGKSSANELFVFVHGFHNTFQDAAYRTAQIAHDINFAGAPVFFSWTSQGSLLNYMTDAENVKPTADHLRRFIEELHDQSGAERIHLIAHSMGSRALTMALKDLETPYREAEKISEVVFAAADIRKSTFIAGIRQFPQAIKRVTLYASAYDSALQLSRAIQGGQDEEYQRAGETKPTPVVAERLQTIDVSFVSVGHSYISDSPPILDDLRDLLISNRPLEPAGKTYIPTSGGGYWVLQ